MKTRIYKMEPENIDFEIINECVRTILDGGTVAFPTETVYGLGANALDPDAVKRIFQAKGRPGDNPLIIHVDNLTQAGRYSENIPEKAHILADVFWPGPLSMIFNKKSIVPYETTGGLETAAFRVPSGRIALELIKASPVPIAAPSANLSGRPSTTDSSHVIEDLDGRVDVIIDAGRCSLGLESTVLDLTSFPPSILRPGGVSYDKLKMVIPDVIRAYSDKSADTPKSPGMKYRHYSPEAELFIAKGPSDKVVEFINRMTSTHPGSGVMCSLGNAEKYTSQKKICVGDIENPEEIAGNIFDALRMFDKMGASRIYSEYFAAGHLEDAIMNRLTKASSGRIVEL